MCCLYYSPGGTKDNKRELSNLNHRNNIQITTIVNQWTAKNPSKPIRTRHPHQGQKNMKLVPSARKFQRRESLGSWLSGLVTDLPIGHDAFILIAWTKFQCCFVNQLVIISPSEVVWNTPTGNYLKFSYLLHFINASLYRRGVRVFTRRRATRKYAKKNLTTLHQWNKLFSFDVPVP